MELRGDVTDVNGAPCMGVILGACAVLLVMAPVVPGDVPVSLPEVAAQANPANTANPSHYVVEIHLQTIHDKPAHTSNLP